MSAILENRCRLQVAVLSAFHFISAVLEAQRDLYSAWSGGVVLRVSFWFICLYFKMQLAIGGYNV